MPIVFSVPNKIKCRSGVDTKENHMDNDRSRNDLDDQRFLASHRWVEVCAALDHRWLPLDRDPFIGRLGQHAHLADAG